MGRGVEIPVADIRIGLIHSSVIATPMMLNDTNGSSVVDFSLPELFAFCHNGTGKVLLSVEFSGE